MGNERRKLLGQVEQLIMGGELRKVSFLQHCQIKLLAKLTLVEFDCSKF